MAEQLQPLTDIVGGMKVGEMLRLSARAEGGWSKESEEYWLKVTMDALHKSEPEMVSALLARLSAYRSELERRLERARR